MSLEAAADLKIRHVYPRRRRFQELVPSLGRQKSRILDLFSVVFRRSQGRRRCLLVWCLQSSVDQIVTSAFGEKFPGETGYTLQFILLYS